MVITMDYQDRLKDKWDTRMTALVAFASREGHSRVPASHVEPNQNGSGDINLGSWVSYLRTRHRKGLLDNSRAGELERLPGWEWGPLRPGPKADADRDAEIRNLREKEGMSLREIGEQYDLSRQRIHQIIS